MLLSGFTFIRNAKKYDFPIVEAVESMLPLVDELVINVGKSEDETDALIQSIQSPKIRIVRSVWDESSTEKGLVLSQQTNIALDACQGRWCLYLQADEALHEKEHALIRKAVEAEDLVSSPTEGFRFRYLHFYGGYSLVQRPWNWYPSEIRIIRRDSGARSFGDAQTFRGPAPEFRELKTKALPAHIYHYGHARNPEVMAKKIHYFHRFWHGDNHKISVTKAYDIKLKDLVWYWGSHPKAYEKRVKEGVFWSLRPAKLIAQKPERVVIYADNKHRELGLHLKQLLGERVNVIVCRSLWDWFSTVMGGWRLRKKSALIDLAAENRPFWIFAGWVLDALCFFGWRIGHAPQGKLSRFRKWVYHALSWGGHEERDRGFVVPESEYAHQLARWVGFDS